MKLPERKSTCLLGGLLLLTAAALPVGADTWDKKTYVTINQPIEVPGAVLPPGRYVFKLVDSASNRHIVRITNEDENRVYATNLAIPTIRSTPSGKTILTFYEMPGGGPEPVRSWFYPGDTVGQQFAYPKQRSMEIARAVKLSVPALPETEQRASISTPSPAPAENTEPAMTEDQDVSPPTPAAQSDAALAAPPEPAPEPEPAPAPSMPSETAQSPAPSSADSGSSAPTPKEPEMPHTAGNGAALVLAGAGSLLAACFLRAADKRSRKRA